MNNEAKEIKINFNTALIIIAIIVISILVVGLCVYFNSSKNETNKNEETEKMENSSNEIIQEDKNTSENNNNTSENMSFTGIKSNYENYDNVKQEILKYFDDDYFPFYTTDLQKYPQVFKQAKVTTNLKVLKVLKSTDEEFEILALDWGPNPIGLMGTSDNLGIDWFSSDFEDSFLIISGKQLDKRLIVGDHITIYGKYVNIENRKINEKDYVLPKIEAINVVDLSTDEKIERFSYKTIKAVSEYIFGKDIKITQEDELDFSYKITLDNQSNSNFKSFDISSWSSSIEYDAEDNNLSKNIEKRLYVGADFQHYIVTTYDENTKHIYIDYFDRNLQKLWNREFNYESKKAFLSPMDYTSSKMAVVIDNELYLLDLKTGKDIIEPVTVGEKVGVVMMDSGMVLIGDKSKDTFVKVSYDGKIISKSNGNTDIEIGNAMTQIVNNKLVVLVQGESDDGGRGMKYIVLKNDGTIESETKDISY